MGARHVRHGQVATAMHDLDGHAVIFVHDGPVARQQHLSKELSWHCDGADPQIHGDKLRLWG